VEALHIAQERSDPAAARQRGVLRKMGSRITAVKKVHYILQAIPQAGDIRVV
jgi:hypothetical protein